jgi:hypothetical protein
MQASETDDGLAIIFHRNILIKVKLSANDGDEDDFGCVAHIVSRTNSTKERPCS